MAGLAECLVLILATYRLATDLAWEDGPAALYSRVRGVVITRAGAQHWLSTGITCPICLSFWIAPLLMWLWLVLPWFIWWLAIAGGAAVLARGVRS